MNPDDVKDCMRCTASLERGYSFRYVGSECKEVICFKCDKLEENFDYMQTRVITSHFMLNNMMDIYDIVGHKNTHNVPYLKQLVEETRDTNLKLKIECQMYVAMLCEKVKEFEAKVWFKGLQDMILKTNERGVSARKDDLKVLSWTGMGRTMITIEDDHSTVSCVADETSKESRTGLQSMHCTGPQALALYDRAIAMYESGELKFELDKKVSLF